MRHAVIMAGGAGVRLWPLSRKERPKQLLRLFDGKSLLRRSYERAAALLPPEQINVITNQDHLAAVAQDLPELPPENLIGEPVGRDTAAAVALPAAVLAERDPEAIMGVFTADHIITPIETFASCVEKAFDTAQEHGDALVTMGIKPTRPDTNYGYVQRGEKLTDGVFAVAKFTEKPDAAVAEAYLAGGEHYWNSGMFVWRATTILDQIKAHLPATHGAVCDIASAWGSADGLAKLERLYPTLEKISIDFAVMERAPRVLVVEMGCKWIDVGSWPALASVIDPDADGNVSTCQNVMHHGSTGNIVVGDDDHLIATIGVDDLVIVRSEDATLVCTKKDSARLKELVEALSEKHGERYR